MALATRSEGQMPDATPEPPRTFTMAEADRIFQVATTLQRDSEGGPGGELTLAQLDSIAAEVGLTQAQVREAIAVMGAGETRPSGFLGAPTVIRLEREFHHEIPVGRDDELVEFLRRRTGIHGVVHREGNTLTWTAQRRYEMLRVVLVCAPGRTTVRLEQLHAGFATMVFGMVVGLGDVAILVAGLDALRVGAADATIALLAVAMVAGGFGTWLLARRILRAKVLRDARTLTNLFTEMNELLG